MSILSGWLKTRAYRKTADGYKKESRDTSSETVYMNDGNTAETNLGDIKGITDSLTATSSNVALSAKGGNSLQGQIDTLNSNLIDGTVNHKTSQRLLSAALTTNNKTMVSSENKNVYIGNEEIEHIFFQLKNETINFDGIRNQVLALGTFNDNETLEVVLKNIFLNILPTDVFCHGHFTWRGTRTFEAFVYMDKRYGYIKTTNWDGTEISIVCNDSNFYYYQNNDNYCSTIVTENISSSVDTYNNSDSVFINVKDSRVKQTDTISDIDVWDCVGRGATTYSSLDAVIIYDGGFVLNVKNLSIIGQYLYRVRYRINRKQI